MPYILMKTIKFLSVLFIFALLTATSCKKDPPQPAPTPDATTGSITLHFKNMVGDSALVLNTSLYVNANNDTFNVTKFQYYISNIRLIKSDMSVFSESESYHLLKADDIGSLEITLGNVPVGNYTGVQFTIGVDSIRNVSGAQTGALDPANGMFWSWNSGYIMTKFEGTSSKSPEMNGMLMYHVGGFAGVNSVLKTVSPSFNSETATVSESITPGVHLKADLLQWFTSPSNIDFSTMTTIHMPGAAAKMVADNYADMFTVEYINN